MGRGYLGGRRQARKRVWWASSARKRRHRRAYRTTPTQPVAGGEAVVFGLLLVIGLPCVLCGLIWAIMNPWYGIGAVGALIVGGVLWRDARHRQRRRKAGAAAHAQEMALRAYEAWREDPANEGVTDYGMIFHEEGLVDAGAPVPALEAQVAAARAEQEEQEVVTLWELKCRAATRQYEADVKAGRAVRWPIPDTEVEQGGETPGTPL